MTGKDAQDVNLELQKATVAAINAYCRVLELHLKAVAEGSSPVMSGKAGQLVNRATASLMEEVELLHSLRHGLIDAVKETASPGAKS